MLEVLTSAALFDLAGYPWPMSLFWIGGVSGQHLWMPTAIDHALGRLGLAYAAGSLRQHKGTSSSNSVRRMNIRISWRCNDRHPSPASVQ